MDRRSGVALWRQIADRIRRAIAEEEFEPGRRLPAEPALAAQFGVNRHTLRSAIAALVDEGILRAEQGRGTFVRQRPRLSYPIGRRTRFSAGLEGQARATAGRLLASNLVEADARIAAALGLGLHASVIRLDTLSEADGRPISRATSYFEADRFAGIAEHFAATGSITAALARHGVEDYLRRTTTVTARHADREALADLGLAPGAIVLVTLAVNTDLEGRPIQFSQTLFAADRVELVLDATAA